MKIFVRDDGVIFGYHPSINNPRYTLVEQEDIVTATEVGEKVAPVETKESLIEYAKTKFNVDIDKRFSLEKVKTKVTSLDTPGV